MKCFVSALLSLSLLLAACGAEEQSAASEPTTAPLVTSSAPRLERDHEPASAPQKEVAPALKAGDQLVTWVDRVNVRAEANAKAKVVARVPKGEPMTFLGDTSARAVTIMLRSYAYQEPWYKVQTKDGQEGWVFGGAIKRPNEQKGNQIITDTNLDFPYFGRYDLNDWKALDTTNSGGGDAETTTKRYQKGAQIMTIVETDMGDYGYHYTWQLRDVEERVLLERELIFIADLDMLLTETVTNRIGSPAVEYKRAENLTKHPVQLGGRPLLVNGAWTKKTL